MIKRIHFRYLVGAVAVASLATAAAIVCFASDCTTTTTTPPESESESEAQLIINMYIYNAQSHVADTVKHIYTSAAAAAASGACEEYT